MMISNLKSLLDAPVVDKKIIAVAQGADADMMSVAVGASRWADFIFVGDGTLMEAKAREAGLDSVPGNVVDCPGEREAAEKAVDLVRQGQAALPMKGLIGTSVFLKAVLDKEKGLRKGDLLSEVSVVDRIFDEGASGGVGVQLITDCAMSIAPDLPTKVKILENALFLARALGCKRPKVAVVAAVETVNPDMPETLDAAALALMSRRGQLKDCVVDGPLALDNALSETSARHKGIDSAVAGRADILLMSDIRMGNVLHKAFTYVAKKRVAAAVMGARVPILMSSRSDHPEDKILAVALACRLMDANESDAH